MFDRNQGRGTRASFGARDGDHICARFRHPNSDSSDAWFTDQLHRDLGSGFEGLQVVDQLC